MVNHKKINITIPNSIYDWIEERRTEIDWSRSRFISEYLKECKRVDRIENGGKNR